MTAAVNDKRGEQGEEAGVRALRQNEGVKEERMRRDRGEEEVARKQMR